MSTRAGSGRLLGLAVLTAAVLGSCAIAPDQPDEPTQADSLWENRTQYVGDSSRVTALANEAGFPSLGDYSVSLQTAAEPYGITLAFENGTVDVASADVTRGATLLLALVGNLDQVSVTAGEQVFSATANSISDSLGYDVKELGREYDRLAEYVDGAQGKG